VKGEEAAQVACGRVRANRNDSPAGVGVLWQRGRNPTLTPGDGFGRADLCISPDLFTNKQGGFHSRPCKLSMHHIGALKPRGLLLRSQH